jgi:hypothetical protein
MSVRATILNGMPADSMPTDETMALDLHTAVMAELQSLGWASQPFIMREMDIRPCAGCFGCWIRTPGRCVIRDCDEIAQAVVRSHLLVLLTPVTFGGYSSELKKGLDRLIFTNLPFFRTVGGETHHRPRYGSSPNLLAIGVLERPDEESERIFTTLVERNAINMFSPRWAAGVVTNDRADIGLQSEVHALLERVGVGS